jgi:hypothetical protein
MTVLNQSNLQWGRAEPYLSLEEFLASPTASMLSFETFVEGGDQSDQMKALNQLIIRASGKVDSHCMGKFGTLCATGNIEQKRSTPTRAGEFIVHPEFSPILAVTAFSYGPNPGAFADVTLDSNNCMVQDEEFTITALGGGGVQVYDGIGALGALLTRPRALGGPQYVQYSYISGWMNSFSTADVASGVSELEVVDPTGALPGGQLTIWDASNDEVVYVANDYVLGANPVTFAYPTQFAHVAGTNISALPSEVKQAVIHFVVDMVEQRGETGFIVDESGVAKGAGPVGSGNTPHAIAAYDLLDNFKRTWGGL